MLGKWVAVLGMLAFGTASSIMSKVNFEMKGVNTQGMLVPFHKPWFCVLVMFVGMSGCMLLYVGSYVTGALCPTKKRKRKKERRQGSASRLMNDPYLAPQDEAYLAALIGNREKREEEEENEDEEDEDVQASLATCSQVLQMLMIAIPASFDLIATVLMSIGLLYVTVSIYQMMRGAELIFAAIFSVLFLGKKLYKLHYVGIGLALVGITMVGVASVMAPEQNNTGTKEQQVLGIMLIVLSQAIQAGQICFEEHFMKEMDFMKPTLVVGLEGIYGFLLQTLIVLPAAQHLPGSDVGGKLENTSDSLHMIRSSTPLLVSLLATAVIMLFYNVLGMQVTGHLGALFRSILETTRTLLAWGVGLALYYADVTLYGAPIGEKWDNYSYLQAAGFVILVAGTLTYGKGDERSFEEEGGIGYSILGSEAEIEPSSNRSTQAVNIGRFYDGGEDGAAGSVPFTPSRMNAYYDFSAGSLSRSHQLRNSLGG